ncbi:MAG: FAD-binding oxidoreductase [Actinomycetota bacterium]|nr:FAD-binding oxidoreductase [Actinomycetota bacterium]
MAPEATLAASATASFTPSFISGWGGGPQARVSLLCARDEPELRGAVAREQDDRARALASGVHTGAIARGMGRSYGDAAQLGGGLVLNTTRLTGFELDPERGTVTAQAGVTLGRLLAELVPAGWIVPVLPGTQHVTIGGAIASDIHGKNHGAVGTFGSHVTELGLLTADGEILTLTPGSDDALFEATVGGMGLTGVILWARVVLRAVTGPMLSVDTDRAEDLDAALALLSEPGGPHRVAWIDMLGPRAGRGVVTRAADADAPYERAGNGACVRARATVPERWPGGPLRVSTTMAFNELWYRRAPRHERGRLEPLGRHYFPLDVLERWPRLYGRHGMLQYQLAVPRGSEDALTSVMGILARAKVPCYLAVLKDFGAANPAPLSFPIPGWTLALDVPRAAENVYEALMRCDELVAERGGRVYLTKDARMRPGVVAAMYPRLAEWRAVRDAADPEGLWRSDLALRTGLVGGRA